MTASPQPRHLGKKRSPVPKPRPIPHILLMVETSGAVGRGIIEGVGRYAIENGPWSIEYEYRSLESLPPEWLEGWQGDGIISRTANIKQAKILSGTKLPLVELHGDPKTNAIHIAGDTLREAALVVDHFLNRGLRHFGYFSYGNAWWIRWYRDGYEKTLKNHGYSCAIYRPAVRERSVPVWSERQLPSILQWLHSLSRPVGILTPGDFHATRLLNICRAQKIAVPEEVAILGRGNDPVICETVRPTLSSIDLDARGVGYAAARLLDQMMAGENPKELLIVPPSHIEVRQSTDLMVIADPDVVQAMQYIRDHACSDIDVPRVADAVGLSRRVLERRFQQHLGRSPKEEITRIRIETAKMLLARTDNSRESIAHKCGFASPAYFSTAFQKLVGMKPKNYRKVRRVSRDRYF